MRKKITPKNYGKFHEAVLISSAHDFSSCCAIADELIKTYGIIAKAVNYEEYTVIPKDIKRLLSKSYHVIFFLSDRVIEEAIDYGKEHKFMKFYAYAHKTNPFSISCVTLNGYNVADNLTYPKYMGDFPSLHRIDFDLFPDYFPHISSIAKTLSEEIRKYYNPKTKKILEEMQKANALYLIRNYLEHIQFVSGKVLVANIVALIVLFIVATCFIEAFILIAIFSIGLFFINTFMKAHFAKKKEEISLEQYTNAFNYPNDPIAQDIIQKAKKSRNMAMPKKFISTFLILFIVFLAFVLSTQYIPGMDSLYFASYFISLYLIKHIICLSADLKEAALFKKTIDDYNTYLEYSIATFNYKRKTLPPKLVIFIIATLISSIIIFSLS